MSSELRTTFVGLAALVMSGCAGVPTTGGPTFPATTSTSVSQPYPSVRVPFHDRAAMHYDFQAKVACKEAEEVFDGFRESLRGEIPELEGVVAKSQVRDCHRSSLGRDRYGRHVSTVRTAISYYPNAPFPGYAEAYTMLLNRACSAAEAWHERAGQMRQKRTGMPPMPTRNAVQCHTDQRDAHRRGTGWLIVDVLRPQGS